MEIFVLGLSCFTLGLCLDAFAYRNLFDEQAKLLKELIDILRKLTNQTERMR